MTPDHFGSHPRAQVLGDVSLVALHGRMAPVSVKAIKGPRNRGLLEIRRAYEAKMLVAEVAMAVRRMREEAGLSQAVLAGLIGVKQPMIARVERGSDPRTPRWDVLRRIGYALGKQLVLDFVSTSRPVPMVQIDGVRPADMG